MGFSGRTTQIRLGFDPELFQIQSRERVRMTRARLGLNHRTIAYFGRLTPEKGVHVLLEALSMLRDVQWQLLIDHFSDYRTSYTGHLERQISALGLNDPRL